MVQVEISIQIFFSHCMCLHPRKECSLIFRRTCILHMLHLIDNRGKEGFFLNGGILAGWANSCEMCLFDLKIIFIL